MINPEQNITQKIGNIITLFISKKDISGKIEKELLTLDKQGIIEDKYHNKDIQRSILLTSIESYDLAKRHTIVMPYGTLGENILMDYNPYHLHAGSKLQIGKQVILEISQYCTMCEHLSNINKQLPTLLKNDRGIFAKVLQEGNIQKGDAIYLLETP